MSRGKDISSGLKEPFVAAHLRVIKPFTKNWWLIVLQGQRLFTSGRSARAVQQTTQRAIFQTLQALLSVLNVCDGKNGKKKNASEETTRPQKKIC